MQQINGQNELYLALFGWWKRHLPLAQSELFYVGRLLCFTSNVAGWRGLKCNKVTTEQMQRIGINTGMEPQLKCKKVNKHQMK